MPTIYAVILADEEEKTLRHLPNQHDQDKHAGGGPTPTIKADVASWEKTKPWESNKEDIQAGKVPGVGYRSRQVGTESASYLPDGTIVTTDEYFRLPQETRRAVLYHEAGHGLESAYTADHFKSIGIDDPFEISNLPGAVSLGGNYSEVLAEAYSALWVEPGWFARSNAGELKSLVTKMADNAGFPLPKQARAFVLRHPAARRHQRSLLRDFLQRHTPGGKTHNQDNHAGSGAFPISRVDGKWQNDDGSPVSPDIEKYLNSLKIPPGYSNVRADPTPGAKLVATGTDTKGRTVYRYSAAHTEAAAAEKFARLKDFNEAVPGLRDKIDGDVQLRGRGGLSGLSPRDRDRHEAASALKLIDRTGMRIGSDRETLAANKAFGATTLRREHVKVDGNKVSFDFPAKKGTTYKRTVDDRELAQMMSSRLRTADQRGGRLFDTNDGAVRRYLDGIGGKDFSPKDFRTRTGTVTALKQVKSMPRPKSVQEYKKARLAVARRVSEELGNTPAVALSAYIDPAVFSPWSRYAA